MSEIRALTADDIPSVARLFQRTFRKSDTPAAGLEAHLAEIFLHHPWQDPDIVSRVYVGQNGVSGFIGALPARMEFEGRRVRAAIAGSLMVDAPASDPMAGARLVRTFANGPQDISITETANDLSRGLWDQLRAAVVPAGSLDWLLPFRSAAFAAALAAELKPWLRPLGLPARVLDPPLRALLGGSARPEKNARQSATARAPASDEAFAETLIALADSVALRPSWTADIVAWLLRHAERKDRYGHRLCRIVTDARGTTIGAYICYTRPGGIARVLNVLARPGSELAVVACLIRQSKTDGLAGIRGRSDPRLIDALVRHDAIFVHRASLIVHSRDAQLLHAAQKGDALLTGIAGETWSRLIGDSVTES
ncbi:hypothetical protein ACUN0C_10830 [Faunimonas sp. B44]|uniref:hypothetical protein n=1 Tax=Faunimonas sp. B44 TaxID=3461493 RepID=UPI004043E317